MLDKSTLEDLYLNQLKTDKEIAEIYETHQPKVSRLRRKYGIRTLTASERKSKQLPPLTDTQQSLIVGSLLGDGWLRAVNDTTAALCETHSEAQEGYLDWKIRLLGPYVSSKYPTSKTVDDREYRGFGFLTHSCSQLRPYHDLFYPQDKRVFPPNLSDLMTPLVFAVWYMDDGSLTTRGEPRIAFGLDKESLRHAIKALKAIGLKPKVYGGTAIHFPKQDLRDILKPLMPECMLYKLPVEKKSHHHNALRLTRERAAALYSGGLTRQEIASLYGVGTSTVGRRLRGVSRDEERDLSVEAANALLSQGGRTAGEVLAVLRRLRSFPYPELPTVELRDRHIERLRGMGPDLSLATSGLKLCYPFFPYRYLVSYRGDPSAYEQWFDDTSLLKAIEWQQRTGSPVIPRRVLKAVTANARTPTVFRPAIMSAICKRYGASVVWDPCAGFGGRLVGAVAAGVRYIATDVSKETVVGNQKLAEWLGADVELHCQRAEEFDPPEVDLVLTSPPYFRQERYIGGHQSWRNQTLMGWIEEFLRPVVCNGARALRRGGHWVLNIADVRDRGGHYPLVELAHRELRMAGLRFVEELEMPIAKLNHARQAEPILVYAK